MKMKKIILACIATGLLVNQSALAMDTIKLKKYEREIGNLIDKDQVKTLSDAQVDNYTKIIKNLMPVNKKKATQLQDRFNLALAKRRATTRARQAAAAQAQQDAAFAAAAQAAQAQAAQQQDAADAAAAQAQAAQQQADDEFIALGALAPDEAAPDADARRLAAKDARRKALLEAAAQRPELEPAITAVLKADADVDAAKAEAEATAKRLAASDEALTQAKDKQAQAMAQQKVEDDLKLANDAEKERFKKEAEQKAEQEVLDKMLAQDEKTAQETLAKFEADKKANVAAEKIAEDERNLEQAIATAESSLKLLIETAPLNRPQKGKDEKEFIELNRHMSNERLDRAKRIFETINTLGNMKKGSDKNTWFKKYKTIRERFKKLKDNPISDSPTLNEVTQRLIDVNFLLQNIQEIYAGKKETEPSAGLVNRITNKLTKWWYGGN